LPPEDRLKACIQPANSRFKRIEVNALTLVVDSPWSEIGGAYILQRIVDSNLVSEKLKALSVDIIVLPY